MLTTMLTLIAAAVAAYSAVLKTKHEKLWAERYDKTGQALIRANLIVRFLQSRSNEYEVDGLTVYEKKVLAENWPVARHELERDMVLIQILFNEADSQQVQDCWFELQKELFGLLEEGSSHDAHLYVAKALPKAEALETSLIELGRRRCVEPFFQQWWTVFAEWRDVRSKK
ncbi:hypothetical protein MBA34_13500 [Pseudomonas capeferrum]|uniref:hypothetical protein n=1 Tax=Pseudomonas capeferrum TaxID=1495066 RepID=UPI0004D9E434|nr:hypothetical protein [Pseudomonas capeferrum]KEY87782.1 hypothetical protein PC358_01320 [Pseudomonas capeferrum]MCH7300054.1 hypothetical protein [Pseudomonas capeferrum]